MATELPSFATVEDLSGWLGEPIQDSPDITRATLALRLASSAVRSETERLWIKPDSSPPALIDDLPEQLWSVTLLCASRAYGDPETLVFKRWSDRVDDGSIDRSAQEVGLTLLPSEKRMLASTTTSGLRRTGMSTVSTTRGPVPPSSDVCEWWVNGPDMPPDEGLL